MAKNRLIAVFAWIVFAFLFIPLLIIVITSFGEKTVITFPIEGFTLAWFRTVFETRSFVSAFRTSLYLAIVSSLVALLLGVPASYALSKRKGKVSQALLSFFISPSIIPGIVVGYALYQVIVLTFRINMSLALLCGHFLIVLPYVIRVVAASLSDFDESIEEAAISLGCPAWKAFFRIVLPNITSAMVAAFMLSFINSFNNIPVSMFLKAPGVSTLPYALISYIEYNYNPTVSALSVILMAATLAIMLIVEKTLGLSAIAK